MKSTSENFEFPRWTSTSKCSFARANCAFSVSSALKFFVLRSACMRYIVVVGILIIMILSGCGKSAASVYLRKGKEYYKKENFQMAIRFFEKSLAVDSNLLEAKYYRALCYYGLGHNHHACEEMSVLCKNGYSGADSTLKNMGCFYFPEDTVEVENRKLK